MLLATWTAAAPDAPEVSTFYESSYSITSESATMGPIFDWDVSSENAFDTIIASGLVPSMRIFVHASNASSASDCFQWSPTFVNPIFEMYAANALSVTLEFSCVCAIELVASRDSAVQRLIFSLNLV